MSFIVIALVALVFIIVYQIAKASEHAAIIRGEEKSNAQTNRVLAWLLVAFFFLGLYGIWKCHQDLMPKMIPESASAEGVNYDFMFKVTLIVTGVVFFATQALLFWFAWRYQSSDKRSSFFYAHNNKLELVWTTIPAIVMAILVAIGLRNWFGMTSPAPKNAQVVEVVGKQFNWIMRYPGGDNTLGKRDFRMINDADNVLGMDRTDKNNADDIISQNGELHVVKGRPIKLIIGSRDVIHDVGLPHFRLKMDAVPGIITTLWFTPIVSTREMIAKTGNPNFVYELSCDQMCGKGHYSMRGVIVVHDTQAEMDEWLKGQAPYFAAETPKQALPAQGVQNAADTTGEPFAVPPGNDSTTNNKTISMITPRH